MEMTDQFAILQAELQKSLGLASQYQPGTNEYHRATQDAQAVQREISKLPGQAKVQMPAQVSQSNEAGQGRGNINPQSVTPTSVAETPGGSNTMSTLLDSVLSGSGNILDVVNQTLAQQASLNGQIQQTQAQGQQLRQTVVNGIAQQAGQAADLQYRQAEFSQQIQDLMGTNLEDPTNAIAASMREYNEAEANRKIARAKYDQLSSVSLLDDPLNWIMAQIELPQAAAVNNQYSAQADAAQADMRNRLSLTAAAKTSLAANTADQTRKAQEDQAKSKVMEAQASLYDAQAKNLADAGSRQLSQLQLLVSATRLDDEQEARKQRLQLKAESDQEIADLDSRLAAVSASLGMPQPMTTKQLKTLGNQKEKEFWLNAANSGEFGTDFLSSVVNFDQRANKRGLIAAGGASVVQTSEQLKKTIPQYLTKATQSLAAQNQGKTLKQEDNLKEAARMYEADITNAVNNRSGGVTMASPLWDNMYNPYKINFVSLNKTLGDAGNNNIFKKYVDTRITAGRLTNGNLNAEDQQAVFSAIIQDVADKKVQAKKAAADIAEYFKAGNAYNLRSNKYNIFGLPAPTSYMYSLEGSWMEQSVPVDLTDSTEVERIMLRRATARNPENLPNMFNSGGASIPFQF